MEDNIKEEKRQAKLQDRAFVDYRKAEILHDIKPKTKAFNLKKFDDSFPRPNKKKEANMEFGELMHKYLMMRPDGRFATWLGKPVKKKSKAVMYGKAPTAEVKGIFSKVVGGPKQEKESPAEKGFTKKQKSQTNQKNKKTKNSSRREVAQPQPKPPTRRPIDENEEAIEDKKEEAWHVVIGEPYKKRKPRETAFTDNKLFWLAGDPIVPEDEEDAYVDADLVAEYTAHPNDPKFPTNPAEREKFFVWGPLPQLYTELKHFDDKKLVIGNTLKSMLESSADKIGVSKKRIDNGHKQMLTWDKKTQSIDYVMESKELEKTAIYEGALQNILKEDAKKE